MLGLGEGTSLFRGSSPLSLSHWLHFQQQQELPSSYDRTTAVLTYSSECREKWLIWKAENNPVIGRFPPENFSLFCILVEEWKLRGQKLVMLLNEDFVPVTVRHKHYTTLQVAGQHMEVNRKA